MLYNVSLKLADSGSKNCPHYRGKPVMGVTFIFTIDYQKVQVQFHFFFCCAILKLTK